MLETNVITFFHYFFPGQWKVKNEKSRSIYISNTIANKKQYTLTSRN